MSPTSGPWSVHPSIPGMVVDANGGWLAHCPHGSRPETEMQARADARLIAAAPALLAFARRVHDALEYETGWSGTAILNEVAVIIAQAEGRTS